MPDVTTILADINTLSDNEKRICSTLLVRYYSFFICKDITQEVRKSCFSKSKVCSHCASEIVVRNSKYKGTQRYICQSYKETFSDFTYSPVLIQRNLKING